VGRSPRTPYPNLNSHLNIYFDLCRCRHLYCLWKDHVSYSEGRGIETGIEDGFFVDSGAVVILLGLDYNHVIGIRMPGLSLA
jgi:hypothetical protein